MRRGRRRKKERKGNSFLWPAIFLGKKLSLIILFATHNRESEKNFVLDEDDYELLEDNNITGFHRPKMVSFLAFPLVALFNEIHYFCLIGSLLFTFLRFSLGIVVRRAKGSSGWKKLKGTLGGRALVFLTRRSLMEVGRVEGLLRRSLSGAYLVMMKVINFFLKNSLLPIGKYLSSYIFYCSDPIYH